MFIRCVIHNFFCHISKEKSLKMSLQPVFCDENCPVFVAPLIVSSISIRLVFHLSGVNLFDYIS